jgi:hypothetical protein
MQEIEYKNMYMNNTQEFNLPERRCYNLQFCICCGFSKY